jgi:hypothetical protein
LDFLGYFYSKSASLTLLIGLCWSHTQASKPLGIVKKNTLELPKITTVMQCYDNKNAFSGFILNVFILNRLRSYLILLCSFRSFRSNFTRVLREPRTTPSYSLLFSDPSVFKRSWDALASHRLWRKAVLSSRTISLAIWENPIDFLWRCRMTCSYFSQNCINGIFANILPFLVL